MKPKNRYRLNPKVELIERWIIVDRDLQRPIATNVTETNFWFVEVSDKYCVWETKEDAIAVIKKLNWVHQKYNPLIPKKLISN